MSAGSKAAVALAATNAVLAVPIGYLGLLTAVGARADRRGRSGAGVVGDGGVGTEPSTRFVVLIPAHDEEQSIGATLASLVAHDYPSSMFAVHVVADNCSDATVDVVREAGVAVHERVDTVRPGKGPALNWLVQRLVEQDEVFDVAVFVDADTSVQPGFLRSMDARFGAGAIAVQGQYGVRDAFTSTPSALRYCALACRHHLRPLGRTALGGSCGLFGNGMAFRRDIVVGRQWTDHLVEDMEFQLELLLDGVTVQYAPDAAVEAEMPHSFEGSVTQHQRWEAGRVDILRRFGPQLVRRIRSSPAGSRSGRVAAVDALADMSVPPLSLLTGAALASAALSTAVAVVSPGRVQRANAALGIGLLVTIATHVTVALRLARAPRAAYRALAQAPRLIIWKVAVMARTIARRGNVGWIRTQRNAEADR